MALTIRSDVGLPADAVRARAVRARKSLGAGGAEAAPRGHRVIEFEGTVSFKTDISSSAHTLLPGRVQRESRPCRRASSSK